MSSPLDILPCVSRDDIRSKKMEKTEQEKAKLKQEEEVCDYYCYFYASDIFLCIFMWP